MDKVRVRFAPSPTGLPHTGNIRAAVFDWLLARKTGGQFILRIEDTDRKRFVPGAAEEMMNALRWLGLDWDEGPEVGGPNAPYYQSERSEIYREYAEKLVASGHAYRCYCTPERLDALKTRQEERGLPTGYDRRCRYLPEDERRRYELENAPHTIRLAAPTEGTITWQDAVFGAMSWECRLIDDQVLLKSDGYALYHLAATIDDHLMGITHVIRGEEWLSSTPKHILIYQFLGWEPPTFVHTTLILGPGRRKLSKRESSAEFLNFAREGYLPEAVLNFVALIGWSPGTEQEIFSREELIERFDLSGLVGHPAILDADKLLWFNGQYLRALSLPDLARRCLPFLQAAGLVEENPSDERLDYIASVIALEQERVKTLADAPVLADFFLLDDDKYVFEDKAVQKWLVAPGVGDRLRWVQEKFRGMNEFTVGGIEAVVRECIGVFEVKGGEVIHPLRVAISGRTVGPGLFESIAVLGKERVERRLSRALSMTNETAGVMAGA
jgi:glutamyl-tRNA synthetase